MLILPYVNSGPVAWDEGMIEKKEIEGGEATVRMYNTNTNKTVHSTFSIDDESGKYNPTGDYSIDGVPGHASRITMSFLDPAGAKTGKALPTGNPIDELRLQDGSSIKASLVDVANPGVFILASDVGIPGDVTPDALGADSATMERLEQIRRAGAAMMCLDPDVQSVPKIVLISKPKSGDKGVNIVCRALSMQQAHKAAPLTLASNLGAACRMPGTLPAMTAVNAEGRDSVVIAHASGKLEVGSVMEDGKIISALLHRTARVLMKGDVFYTLHTND